MSPDLDLADEEASASYEQIASILGDVSDGDEVTIRHDGDLGVVLTRYQIEHGRALDWKRGDDSLYRVQVTGTLDGDLLDFDVRSIPPQRRHEVLTATFANLDAGEGFVLVNDHDPKPLYHELRSIHGEVVGWEYESRGGEEGWRVRIAKTDPSIEMGSDVHTQFDVREIPKPERHETIHHRYGMMPDGERMEIVAPHEPKPLHREFVDRYGNAFDWQVVDKQPGEVTVHIEKQESGDDSGDDAPAPEVTEELDVRNLPPAQRHEQIFDAYEGLDEGEGFVLVNDHDPKPLYHQFDAEAGEQFHWEYEKQSPGEFRVLIGKSEGVGHRPAFGDQGGHGHGHGHGGHGHSHGGGDHGHGCDHEEEDTSAPF